MKFDGYPYATNFGVTSELAPEYIMSASALSVIEADD